MSDADDNNSSGRRPLSLKRPGAGTVQQSFARGRSKAVVVEKKRKRVVTPGKDSGPAGGRGPGGAGASKGESALAAKARQLGLSEEELVSRQRAIARARAESAERDAKRKQEEAERSARADAERQNLDDLKAREAREAEEAQRAAEAEAEARRLAEADASRDADDGPKKGDGEVRRKPAAEKRPQRPMDGADLPDPAATLDAMGGRIKRKGPPVSAGPVKPGQQQTPARAKADSRRRGKLTIQNILEGDEERQRSLASVRRAREREKQRRSDGTTAREKISREVIIPESITVADLANRMAERSMDVIKYLMKQGQMVRMDDVLEADDAELIVEDFGHTVKRVSESDVETGFIASDDPEESKVKRAPVVAIMGHVDHGKTSLLDALRSTDVVSGEAGGITQHIGAYQVQLKSGDKITFLDTPGHAAFSAMRSRGAEATDIVILVVAADDSVKPQTIEAIKFAKAAGTPIIVAVNKIDKHEADPQKVITDLLQHDIVVEAMSGDVQSVNISAKKRTGLDDLTDAILLQAELQDLKANPDRDAEGVVIESKIDKGRGSVATVLVRRGTLKRGDLLVAGGQWGRVRALTNERGQTLAEAGPSVPVEVLGLDGAPDPGEVFAVVENEGRAREIAMYRQRKTRSAGGGQNVGLGTSLEQMMARLQENQTKEMPLLIKADVQGSAEAIKQSLERLGNDEVQAKIVLAAAGGVNEGDVLLAKSSGSPIFAFNVRANKQARDLAEREKVEIRYYSVIYDVIDDVRNTMEGMLAPEKRENFIGYADILEVFNITRFGKAAGCRVTEGVVKRGCGVRLLRNDTVVHEGHLSTLKRFKEEVKEVKAGTECGMGFIEYQEIQKGDKIECFEIIEVPRKLESNG
ncbi:translation initiation factor IF-2 [Maricaulis salignorans]|uniref:Translation initiation factor IF-2 n=1 Tax=Maricaulis salignorans TaxID=144026 RepID=A0A1G9V2Y1_9PROT|nr:translation initiation factor IF-2 [Maricaulis salignorans]SDM66215.1 bacterial translation initiation factor 2 (bIF-2) [Maricaulis salignorans]